ncbi:hypothetical protein HGA34_03580 [Candidatus Falkowbacteria bacterium]|nr:hypothetical protein [Candidatus Falkowbacteria bacterium]
MINTPDYDTDKYIKSFPQNIQKLLAKVRAAIKKEAPAAEETIKYGIPTFVLQGNLVHFAAYSGHIGFYPTPSAIKAFDKELKGYKRSKGAIQFPLDEPLPLDLIARMTRFRVQENLGKAKK